MAINKEEFIKSIETMTALELKELVSAIEEHFGVTAVAVAAGAAAGPAEAEEKATAASLFLKEVGPSKVAVIKVVKEIKGLDLMAAKKIVDAVAEKPQLIMDNLDAGKLAELEAKLKETGAITEVK